jgi:hypothetical protein
MSSLKVGDVCITVNSSRPAINNGILMVILRIDPNCKGFNGESIPYLIRRVDGQALGSTTCMTTGFPQWCKHYEAHCEGYKLKRIGDQVYVDEVKVKREVPA